MSTAGAARGHDRVDFAFSRSLTDLLASARGEGGLVVFGRVLLLCWAPMLALAAAQGLAIGDAVAVPFLYDLVANVRVLVAMPLLLLGVGFAEGRLDEAVALFTRGGLVDDALRPRFEKAVRSCARAASSRRADLAALVLAVGSSALLPELVLARAVEWRADEAGRLTWAGAWLAAVVVPFYRFLLLRWLIRFAAWAVLLVRVSRLELRLPASHPDRAGGLAFVGGSLKAFAPAVLAMAATYAADLGNQALHDGAAVEGFKRPIATCVLVTVAVWLAPLLAFTPSLLRLRTRALFEHDVMASRCARTFERMWVRADPPADPQALLRGEDAQSMDALGQVLGTVRGIKPLPLDVMDLLALVAAPLLPTLPLLLTLVSPAEVGRLLQSIVA